MVEIGVKRVDLLPYHKLRVANYELLRRLYELATKRPPSDFLNDFRKALHQALDASRPSVASQPSTMS